jgi:hypothetical protein
MRFANKVLPNSIYFPPGGPKNSGHGETDSLTELLCTCYAADLRRQQQHNMNGSAVSRDCSIGGCWLWQDPVRDLRHLWQGREA